MFSFSTLLAATLAAVSGANALSSTLQQITANIGSNPNNVGFYLYKPTKLASPTPLIVALHECSASAQVYFGQTNLPSLADEHGFIMYIHRHYAIFQCTTHV
jgi:acetylxylan esterase